MGLFSRKRKVHANEFCGDFYDKNILAPVIAGVDMGEVYVQTVARSVAEVDARFSAVDSEVLLTEMTVMRFEVFGVAWLHQLGDKHAAAQTAFTKRYLEAHSRHDIWDAMEPYNHAIARSTCIDTPSGKAYPASLDTARMDRFDLWHEQGFDVHVIARAANRLGTDVAWKRGLAPGFAMLTLCARLGCEVNEEAQFRLVAAIRGFYDGACGELRMVRLQT